MAADGTSIFKAQRNMQRFTTILTSTACEWFLIFLLLIDAVFTYLLTKFARYWELQLPCIFCSRLDHVLGNEKREFYRTLLCSNHRLEISSLISCHIHGKLADGYAMCDDCLLSFTTKDYPNPDRHRLFLGKLGFDSVNCGSHGSSQNGDFNPISLSNRFCSCCNKPWRSRQNVQRLLQLKSTGTRATKPNIPLPRRLNHRDGLKKIRDKFSGPVTCRCIGKSASDPLSHVGYSELKITSDSESEVPFSDDDDDDGSSVICDINEAKDNAIKPHDIKCLTPDVWHDLAEFNWQQPDHKTYYSPLPELISLDDISLPSNTPEVPAEVSPICQSVNPTTTAETVSLVDMNLSFDVVEVPVGSPLEKSNVAGTTEARHRSINHHEEILKLLNPTAGAGIKMDQVLHSPAPLNPTNEDISDVCKLAVSGKGREVAGSVVEKSIEKERGRDTEDLVLSAQNSAQGINITMNNINTHVRGCADEFKITDSTSSSGIQRSVLAERTESAGLDLLDGSSVSEIEGESTIDRLKRQVEYDRRCMNALYKELDEERSASAIAANQAMAMITRLQEEKAALHMEALQYLRMMEEQAEYDVEALEKANDLLAEKEKEIQDFEAALESYRLKYPDDMMMEAISEDNHDFKKENVSGQNMSLDHIKDSVKVPSNLMYCEIPEDQDKPDVVIYSWAEFEDEKLYIMQRLKSLERKLQTFARDRPVHDISDDGHFEAAADGVLNQGKHLDKEGNSVNCWTEENVLSSQKDLPLSNGSTPAQKGLNASICEDEVTSIENGLVINGQTGFTHCGENDLVVIENEISDLNDRLEALENDYNFLEHTFNFLQNGNEGLSFIQEIARQLQEIRKIEIRSSCQSVP